MQILMCFVYATERLSLFKRQQQLVAYYLHKMSIFALKMNVRMASRQTLLTTNIRFHFIENGQCRFSALRKQTKNNRNNSKRIAAIIHRENIRSSKHTKTKPFRMVRPFSWNIISCMQTPRRVICI